MKRISVSATECSRIPSEFLEEEQVVLGSKWFAQEYMMIWCWRWRWLVGRGGGAWWGEGGEV
jgi:hypothetical protein